MSYESYYQKCVALLRSQGGGAALNAILEEGNQGDGTDWKALYEEWSKEEVAA